ncbi:hypothetical protein BCR39DRAFT_250964 [Naematelia encephala]|uniref:Uncharacterized protein n=1 Tax=Naematelia encephala TaxID=71784 RepID=A0A1Y2AW42_9TREE|nr:hypothetical protein BCR39DRAFT_250964 [Naematelia encephala]
MCPNTVFCLIKTGKLSREGSREGFFTIICLSIYLAIISGSFFFVSFKSIACSSVCGLWNQEVSESSNILSNRSRSCSILE